MVYHIYKLNLTSEIVTSETRNKKPLGNNLKCILSKK